MRSRRRGRFGGAACLGRPAIAISAAPAEPPDTACHGSRQINVILLNS
jgi:hypothetical protein